MNSNYSGGAPSESTSLHRPHRQSKKSQFMANSDGFTVISSCFFVLTITVTIALVAQIHYGGREVVPHGAIASDDRTCSEIGMHVMHKGGTAVDVAIASLLCLTVTHPHLAGVGGGGVILLHDHKSNKSTIFDFMTSALPHSTGKDDVVGVPGFLRGLEVLHGKYGYLDWKDLVLPAASLARNGFKVSAMLAKEVEKEDAFRIREVMLPKGQGVAEGQLLQRKPYAEFLEDLAYTGSEVLHSQRYASEILNSLRSAGSSMTLEDLQSYQVTTRDPVQIGIRNNTLTTAGLPFGGGQTLAGVNHLQNTVSPATPTKRVFDAVIEGMNLGNLWLQKAAQHFVNDSDFETELPLPRDLPATQVVAVDAYDLYVSAVVGLGGNFGAKIITPHQIILNNHLEDAYIFGKGLSARPLTPYTPLMLMNSRVICGQRLLLSSASSSANMQVVVHFLLRGLDMLSAIRQPRLAQGESPFHLLVDDDDRSGARLSGEIRSYLTSKNYTIKLLFVPLVVNGIYKIKDSIVSHSDTRGGGVAARLDGIPGENNVVEASSFPSNVATLVVPKEN